MRKSRPNTVGQRAPTARSTNDIAPQPRSSPPFNSSTHKFALSRACPGEKVGCDAATETVARFHEKWNTDENSAGFQTAMLRDDSGNGGRRPSAPRNVLGDRLEVCSISPMTGFFRDGCCDTGREDIGSHTVCAVMTARFSSSPNPAATIFRHRCRNSAFAASSPAIVGACVHPVGRKHSRRAKRPAWSCAPLTKAPGPLLARRSQTLRNGSGLKRSAATVLPARRPRAVMRARP